MNAPASQEPASGAESRFKMRQEFKAMSALALPVVMAELGWMAMGVVDTLMVAPLGPQAIGATGFGSTLFFTLGIIGMGFLLGLDTLVSQAFGAGRHGECHAWLLHGFVLAALLIPPLLIVGVVVLPIFASWNIHPDVSRLAVPYVRVVNVSVAPLLFYTAARRYLQATGRAGWIAFALVSANLVNVVANWMLIHGKLGMPALGVTGSAWATVTARIYMAAVLIVGIVWTEKLWRPGTWQAEWHVDPGRLRRLLKLGAPAAGQLGLEVGVFAAVTALAGRLEPIALAAHQIALNVASLTFMVPLGLSSAGAVRVGHAVGRRDPAGAERSGWTALFLGATFMSAAALVMFALPISIVRLFTLDPRVIATGAALLVVAAVFQLFDGIQVVATGVLRGLGDTHTPMVSNLAGHWLIGLPAAYFLCFNSQLGVIGLWIGLLVGLFLVGCTLLLVWRYRIRELRGTFHTPAVNA